MSVSFNAALNAYNKAAQMPTTAITNQSGSESATGSNAIAAFGNSLAGKVGEATNTLRSAEAVTAKSLVKQADLTDVVTAVTKAEVTLRTAVEVRDRLITAMQEILRMPI
ncbi:MAG: flagellar hook-basal body complex protein FliE [Rickettsiales bacterium]|nr:flagellar hook-basal body complex protein FliE [Pseudomonadota bacterium]MDA0965900.1 flagellar hook-basal body complex protein FliE [Pseudomonadota bacterium]MDG4542630.1 flagellar hook-basal body complex protein FliE [Rickettsiales bacterium]MDG4545134.1 flagellar hook-basal body complex protein FliE [Rickettsiales bacterium]MDG4547257.1 flagellar hook-basal body complex protein FliE [Rickettsiales bacterium]